MKRTRLLALLFAGALLSGFGHPARSQAITWQRYIQGVNPANQEARDSWPFSLSKDGAGNLLVGGWYWGPVTTFDDNEEMYTAKLSAATGATAWTASYTGPFPDAVHSALADAAGDVYISGTATFDANGNAVVRVEKRSGATGQLLWNATAPAPGHQWSYSQAMVLDPAGNPIITARHFTRKYRASDGAILWTSDAGGRWIELAANGDVVVSDLDAITRLSGGSGQTLWAKPSADDHFFYNIALDTSGNAFTVLDSGKGAMKLTAAGALAWDVLVAPEPGFGPGYSTNIALDAAGDAYFAQIVINISVMPAQVLIRTIKLSGATGAVLWTRNFTHTGNAPATLESVAVDAAGNVYVAGGISGSMRVLRYSSAGTLTWNFAYNGSAADGRDYAWRILAEGGDVYVTGKVKDAVAGFGIQVFKIDVDADLAPSSFAFATRGNANLQTVQVSDAVVPTGYNRPSPITVSAGEFSLDCTGVFQSAAATITPGQSVCVRHTSSGSTASVTTTTLTIGGVSGAFSSTTAAIDDELSNPQRFAAQQYRDFLGREGEGAGVEFYRNLLAIGALTRTQVVGAFLASPEFQNGLPQCTRLYFSFFGRIPDYDGLLFQVGRYRAGDPLTAIAQNFANSPEFTERFGMVTDEQYVDLVYQNVLGRAPDAEGRQFYLDRLGDGRLTRGEMMVNFSESAEFQQIVANEVYVTAVYVGLLRRTPDQGGLDFYVNLIESGLPPGQIVTGFLNSPEYASRFRP